MMIEWMPRIRWTVLVALLVCIGCGDPDPGPVTINGDEEDTGVDSGPDAGDDDIGEDGDAGDDADVTDPDFPVDGEGDNCPQISNPDQLDRSRDGVGDACANYPFYHDPSNPVAVEVIEEDDDLANGTFFEARQNWLLDLPFMLEGAVSTAGELDYYAIEIEEPTTVLFHMEALSSSMWPTMIVIGDDSSNRDYESVLLSPNRGEDEVRDVHFPTPGVYIIVISDYNNLTGGSPSGGAGYEYRLSLSTPPLLEPESVSLPAPRKVVPYDQRVATVFSVNVSGEDALKVSAAGAPRNQMSMVIPSIQFFDGDTGEALAFTLSSQADTDTMRNELTMKVGDELERVHIVVEGHQSLGLNDLVVDIKGMDKPKHLASFDDPRQSREDRLLWMRPGAVLEAIIGPPRPVDDTSLEADENYFLMLTNPGDFFRVVADPIAESQVVPELAVGEIWSSTYFTSWHRGYGASSVDEVGSLSALITADNRGGAVLNVRHAGNTSSSLPVGGDRYSYDLRVESLDVFDEAEQIENFPASIPIVLEAGEQGLYDVAFKPGHRYDITYNGGFNRRLELVDTETWEIQASTTGSHSFVHRADQDLILAVRDSSGYALTSATGINLEIVEGDGPEDLATPATVDGVLDDSQSAKIYEISASEGELIEARAASPSGSAVAVEIAGSSIAEVESDDSSFSAVYVEEDTDLLVIVSRPGTGTIDYTLGVHAVDEIEEPETFESVDEFADPMKSHWRRVSVDADTTYSVNVVGESELGNATAFGVYDVDTLEKVVESAEGFDLFNSGARDEVYLVAADPDGPISTTTDYGLSLSKVEPVDYGGAETVDAVDGLRPIFMNFDNGSGGLSTLEVTPENDHDAYARIVGSSYVPVEGQALDRAFTAVARSESRDFVAVVIPRGVPGEDWSAAVEIETIGADEATVLDASEATSGDSLTVAEWPAVYQGTINDDLSTRSFTSNLSEGSSLWAITMPAPGTGANDLSFWLDIYRPSGGFADYDIGSGEGTFSKLSAIDVDEDGDWRVELMRSGAGDGEFILYLLLR